MSEIEEFLTPPPVSGHFRPREAVAPDGDHMAGLNLAIQDMLRRWDREGGPVSLQFTLQINPGNVIEYVATAI
jgi:hypothetical protein